MTRVSVFKKTNDDWFPAYEIKEDKRVNRLVEVSFILLRDNCWRVCAWGADDYGLERDFSEKEESTAWNIFLQIIGMEYVNKSSFKQLGFVIA